MSLPVIEPTAGERRQIIDRVARIVADEFCAEVNLLTPEVVAALCKCDIRTLESRGLAPVRLGPRMIRYRKADLDALIRSLTDSPARGRWQMRSPSPCGTPDNEPNPPCTSK